MKKTYTVGSHTFPRKKDIHAHLQRIIQQGFIEIPEGTDDFVFLLALLQSHPRSAEKIGSGVVRFYIEAVGRDAPNFGAVRTDGTRIPFSYTKCLDALGRPTEEAKAAALYRDLTCAYRSAVYEDIRYFKTHQKSRVCAICGANIVGQSDVDHVSPSFIELVRQFEAASGRTPPMEFTKCGETNGYHAYSKKFCDEVYAEAWREFHRAHAVLRIVCSPCNLKRKKTLLPGDDGGTRGSSVETTVLA